MKRFTLILFCFVLIRPEGHAQDKNIRYEILLSYNMLGDSIKNSSLSSCLDISPESLITISDGSRLYLLGWGGIISIGNKSNHKINSFAYSSDGMLFAVADNDLCYINKDGNWKSIVSLPASQMAVAGGKDVMYIYDHNPDKGKYHAYVIAKGGRYRELFTSPKPVIAMCEMGDTIYVAIESGIYSYSPQTNKLEFVFALQKENTITSLSADPEHSILYFSTNAAIYAFKSNSIVTLTRDFPGSIVRYSGTGLLIFNSLTKDILHIVNVENSIEF